METISPEYRELNRKLHERRADYGLRSGHHLARVLDLLERHDMVLDYGCGKNTLVPELQAAGFTAYGYDPCIPELAENLSWADVVVCTDVLEHVEPGCLRAVLAELRAHCSKLLYCQIALRLDSSKSLPDGSNPHKLVLPWEVWQMLLEPYFEVVDVLSYKPGKQVTFTARPVAAGCGGSHGGAEAQRKWEDNGPLCGGGFFAGSAKCAEAEGEGGGGVHPQIVADCRRFEDRRNMI